MNRDLEAVFVFVDEALNFQEIFLLEGADRILDVVPHLGFDLAATVGKRQCEIGLAAFLGLHLLGDHHEAGGNNFVFEFMAIGEEKVLHDVWPESVQAVVPRRLPGSAKLKLKQPNLFLLF